MKTQYLTIIFLIFFTSLTNAGLIIEPVEIEKKNIEILFRLNIIEENKSFYRRIKEVEKKIWKLLNYAGLEIAGKKEKKIDYKIIIEPGEIIIETFDDKVLLKKFNYTAIFMEELDVSNYSLCYNPYSTFEATFLPKFIELISDTFGYEYLHNAIRDRDSSFQYDIIMALGNIDDNHILDILIKGLEDDRVLHKSMIISILKMRTRKRFGFDYMRWKKWWEKNKNNYK